MHKDVNKECDVIAFFNASKSEVKAGKVDRSTGQVVFNDVGLFDNVSKRFVKDNVTVLLYL